MRPTICLLVLVSSLSFAQQPSSPIKDYDTLYGTVDLDGAKLQTIVTRPRTPGRHPAVLLIPGLGCYSLARLDINDPYAQLLIGLTRRGYVTMRVDKNGEGASGGPPCDSPQSDLQYAARRSVAGLNALAQAEYVDRDKIFVLAHSIGPLEGVLVVSKFPVRGVIAAETIGKSWFEYQLENTRRQMLIMGRPYDVTEREARTNQRCQYRFLIEKQTPEQVLKSAPECRDAVNTFGVSYTYLQQIADLNLAAEWKKVDVPVLVTWGTSDPATTAEENKYLVDMINSFHPGRATYVEFPGMGHGLDLVASPRAWLDNMRKGEHGRFNTEFLERVDGWMKRLI